MDRTIDSLIDDIKQSFADNGEDWRVSPHYERVYPGKFVPYVLNDNAGFVMLTEQDLLKLKSMGYLVHEDVIYHPDHWEPTGDTLGGGVLHGHDGAVKAKSHAAYQWGVGRHLWSKK